jgi:hypothetical protein
MSSGYFLLDHRKGERTWYPSRIKPLRVIVVHVTAGLQDMDAPDASAEKTAQYAATTTRKVSWHSGSDSDSFLRLLPATYTAFHVQGYNSSTYGHEISKATTRWAGMPPVWVERTLANAAACLRPVAAQHRIPPRVLSRAQVDAGQYGFIGHAPLDPTRRTDPGVDFPWARFFELLGDQPLPPAPPPVASEEDRMFRLIRSVDAGKRMAAVGPGYFRHLSGEELLAFQAAGLLQNPQAADDVNDHEFNLIKQAIFDGSVHA